MRHVTIVIPMRNERAAVRPLFAKLRPAMEAYQDRLSIVVVDGFSTDGTPDVVMRHSADLPLELIAMPENMGLGGALEKGLQRALESTQPDDAVVTMDGDDSHDPSTIPSMLAMLEYGHDAVVASRYQPGSREWGVSLHRRLLSRTSSLVLRRLFPMGQVRDYSSGFRAYRASALARIRDGQGRIVTEQGFACMMEVLLKLRGVGASVAEVPLVLRYDLKKTDSKMQIGSTILRYLAVIRRNLATDGRSPASESSG